MGDHFLDSVQGLKDLKIFSADKMQHLKKNQTSEEFRKITMKVLVMQLASTTIMDFVAYGGAGPLSLALGFGEVTMKRYTLGVVPTKEYSCIIRKALESPIYFKSLLEKNKDKLNSSAYKKAKAASEKLCQMTNMSDTILATISYIFYRLDEVTPLALQKILYFCQGHHLLKFNKPLFTEDCLAWDHGPVYRKVYDLFKKLTYHVIEDDYYAVIKNRHLSLGDEQKEVIDLVLETYGLFNGKVLEHITHQQAPYNNTNHNEIIEKEEITNYYKTLKE